MFFVFSQKKSVIRSGLITDFLLSIENRKLCHYQARAFKPPKQYQKQQGYNYPCCADNDDNAVENCFRHLLLFVPFGVSTLLVGNRINCIKCICQCFFLHLLNIYLICDTSVSLIVG